ncbi:ABC transporter substrate-binding protein [Castellaniella caeni]|uniref:ABC transporter substrate-binding protein n=1 Tax=Castellaniella caeni TaxID=266123 RepID=UPI000A63A68B|nr:ABC transporter substrate-binding protein [Castellaniella caeni]
MLKIQKTMALRWMASGVIALLGLNVQAAEPIRIGSFVSATGPAAFLGDPQLKTLQMYVEKVNQDGGVLGRPLELIAYDDGSDVSKAVSLAKRLIYNDHVDVIIGAPMTGAAMAVIPLVEKAEVPFIALAGGISIIEPVKKWVFKTALTDRIVAQMVFKDMQKRGLNKIALVTETSGYGQSGKKESERVAPDYGIQIVAQESYGAKDTDMTPQLTKIKHNPDVQAVFVFGVGQGPALLTRNYRQLGIAAPLYQSYAVCANEYIRIARDAADGVRLPCSAIQVADTLPDSDPQKKVVSDYAQAFHARWNLDASHFSGGAYDGLMIYLDAVKRAGTTDKAKVRDAIEQTHGLMLTSGAFNMTPENHMGLDVNAYRMLQIERGKWTLAP